MTYKITAEVRWTGLMAPDVAQAMEAAQQFLSDKLDGQTPGLVAVRITAVQEDQTP